MSSLRQTLIFFLLSALFAAKNSWIYGHSLLQRRSLRSEFNCTLAPDELQAYRRGERRWIITDSGLGNLDGDIQSLVNCTEAGDVLLFNVGAPVQPPSSIAIPWNLTISSLVKSPRSANGSFPEASRKVTIVCPRQDEGVFLVDAKECLLANFVFQNCSLNRRRREAPYGIITTASCSTGQHIGTIALHHLEFEANILSRSAALYVREPSCSDIQIIDVRFQDNVCSGTCAASLVGQTEIQNITLTENKFFEEDVRDPILISINSGSNTTIYGLVASRNNGTVVHAQNANLSISNARIFQNSGGLDQSGYYYTGGVTLIHSFGEILDSRFEENTGSTGSSIAVEHSSIVIRRTSVVGCKATARGGGISITSSSTVRIQDSLIANNSAGLDGGGVYSHDTTDLRIANTAFEMNFAERGGGLYLDELMHASLLSCHFIRNRVTNSGGGAHFENGIYVIENNTFNENESDEFGGGLTCFDITLNVSDTMFSRNNVSASGGGSYATGNTSAWFVNCTWESNMAGSDGGGAFFEDGPHAVVTNSSFRFNQAESGGGGYAAEANIMLFDVAGNHNMALQFGAFLYFTRSIGRVSNCRFTTNSAVEGGVFYLIRSEAWISTSSFKSNEASDGGGAIRCGDPSNLTIEDSYFASNSANQYGGAIYVIGSVVSATNLQFQNNRATSFGGAVSVHRSASASFSYTEFFNETNGHRGGAISVTEAELELRNISIVSCSAVSGGGIYLYRSLASINDTSVTRCKASESGGGGIRMDDSKVTGHGLNISLNMAVGDSQSGSIGGGISLDGASILDVRHTTLDRNSAQFGAGIYATEVCTVLLSDGRLYDNLAWTSGGAAFIRDSSLTFQRVVSVRNSAFYGGSFYASNSSLILNESQLIHSSSMDAGGSILAQDGATIVMEGTTIQSSRAANGGGIMLMESYFWGFRVQFRDCSAGMHGGGVGLNESSSFLCTECLFKGNSASEEGGALRLESETPQMLAFQLENTEFRDNNAAFGGAIHFQTGDGSANCSDVDSAKCTFLSLSGCVFSNNSAGFVGGAILANYPSAVRVSCEPLGMSNRSAFYITEELRTLREVSSLDVVCENWTENVADAYGPIIGSYARRVSETVLLGPNQTIEISGDRYELLNHPSGHPLPTLFLEAVDQFGQGPALIQGNQQIKAIMKSPDGLFAGIFEVIMEDSRGNFSGITAFKQPGNYSVQITFNGRGMPTLIIDVQIRHCVIGESIAAHGTVCEPCDGDTYNFYPLSVEEKCSACPNNANCDSVAIRPKKGFWHQTPCSVNLHRCLSERACDFEGRDTRLLALGSNIEECNFDNEFVNIYSEALCQEGYTGPLCGSCVASHGKTRSFRCEKCYGRLVNIIVVVLAASFALALAAFQISSALPAHEHSANIYRSRRNGGSSSIHASLLTMSSVGIVDQGTSTQGNNANTPATPEEDIAPNLKKLEAMEIFKITISYLQVSAIAVAVNVAWTSVLITLFEIAEFFGGVTSETAGRSTNCLTSADFSIPRSAVRIIVDLTFPLLVFFLCTLFWIAAMLWNGRDTEYLRKRCLLSLLVVSYLNYIAVTKTAVNTLFCLEVHDSIVLGDDSATKYWAVDTALKCNDEPHTVLASLCGWPVLTLFSLGFPVVVAYLLNKERNENGDQISWSDETAGFLYKAYKKEFMFWESVVLLRKAALAVIVVFAYPLGGNLQGTLAVCVLMVALYLHLLCSPYRERFSTLNHLEGLSLFISALTFVSGLFFNDERTSSEATAIITAFTVIANVGLFLYLFWKFSGTGAAYLMIVLQKEKVPFDENAWSFKILAIFIKNRLDGLFGSLLKLFNPFAYRRHEEPIPDEV